MNMEEELPVPENDCSLCEIVYDVFYKNPQVRYFRELKEICDTNGK